MSVHPGLTFGTRVVVEEHSRGVNGVRWLCRCTVCGSTCAMHAGQINAALRGKIRRRCQRCYRAQLRRAKDIDRFWKRVMWLDTWGHGMGLYTASDVDRMCRMTMDDLEATFGELPPPDPRSLWVDPGYREGGIK